MSQNLIDLIYELKGDMKICEYLDKHEMQQVIPCFELIKFPAGGVVFKEGDPGDFMGFVVSGKLEITKQTEFKGKQIIVALLGKGSFVGEISTFDTLPRSTTVKALVESELIILRRETLDNILQEYPQAGIKILQGIIRILSIRLRKTTERLTHIF
jgi:CRP-like cAMP-binding protein